MNDTIAFQGPDITWNREQVKRVVERYGKDKACELLAGDILNIDYVRRIVESNVYEEDELLKDSILVGSGAL